MRLFDEQVSTAIAATRLPDDIKATLSALSGNGGHSHRVLAADAGAQKAQQEHLVALMSTPAASVFASKLCFKIEVNDDIGASAFSAPQLLIKALSSRIEKAAAATRLDGFANAIIRVCRDLPADGDTSIVLTYRILAFAESGATSDRLKNSLEATRLFSTSKVPQINVEQVADNAISAALIWMSETCAAPIKLATNEEGRRRWNTARSELRRHEALRLFESRSQTELSQMCIGLGKSGKSVLRQARKGVLAAQKGRPPRGIIIVDTFDIWAFWASVWMTLKRSDLLPYRTDIPLKIPVNSKLKRRSSALPPAAVRQAHNGKRKRRSMRRAKPDEA
jgi:hypothetical protein